jgi:hypothetical protein
MEEKNENNKRRTSNSRGISERISRRRICKIINKGRNKRRKKVKTT